MMSTNYPTKEMFSAAATQWRCWLQWTHSHSTSESQFQGWKTPKLIVFGHNGLFNNGSSCHCVGCWVLGCSYQWANFWSPLPPLSAPHCCLLGSLVSTQLSTQLTSSSQASIRTNPGNITEVWWRSWCVSSIFPQCLEYERWPIELETNLCKEWSFRMTEKAPSRTFSWLKVPHI